MKSAPRPLLPKMRLWLPLLHPPEDRRLNIKQHSLMPAESVIRLENQAERGTLTSWTFWSCWYLGYVLPLQSSLLRLA